MLLIWIYIAGSVLAVIATASAILYFDRKHDEISMRLMHSFIHIAATYAAAALLSWMWMLVLAVSIVTVRTLTLDFFEEDGCDE